MENQNNNRGLKFLICFLCILVLTLGGYIIYDKTSNKNLTNDTTNTTETNKVNDNQTSENDSFSNTYKIDTIKTIYDVINDNDTKLVKAQKIAKEVMNAVNNKDWYYLAKIVGNDADNFIKYGINNYKVNINDYEESDDEYIFSETYESSKTTEEELGNMLIIRFEDGGRIVTQPNCTGE